MSGQPPTYQAVAGRPWLPLVAADLGAGERAAARGPVVSAPPAPDSASPGVGRRPPRP
ncbi:hypothetical protein [Streptomyces sp. NPDC051677]|uniref:hypothetical protein n=1 Tax=Streptomyces sp. NPDC051677 TaxID=3365669 RepID=UPI0037D4B64D